MATRIYLPSSGSPPVTPSTWIFPNQINPVTYAGSLVRSGTAMTTKTDATGTTSPTFRAQVRYVIGPLAAQTISGTVRSSVRVRESNTGANATRAIAAKIIQPNGSDRGVLLTATASDSATAPYEMTTTLDTRRCWTASETEPIPLTSQAAQAGDYLVIELGFRSATTTSRNVDIRIGDAASDDCPYSDGDTNDYCGWVEFSADISFQFPIQASATGIASDAGAASITQVVGVQATANGIEASASQPQIQVVAEVNVGAEAEGIWLAAGAAQIGQDHEISAYDEGIESDAGAVAIEQQHALQATATGIASHSGSAVIVQLHNLNAEAGGIASGAGPATIGRADPVSATATGLQLAAASAAISQAHQVGATAEGLAATAGPVAIAQAYHLQATSAGIEVGNDSPTIGQEHRLEVESEAILTDATRPIISLPGEISLVAVATGIATAAQQAELSQVHQLQAMSGGLWSAAGTVAISSVIHELEATAQAIAWGASPVRIAIGLVTLVIALSVCQQAHLATSAHLRWSAAVRLGRRWEGELSVTRQIEEGAQITREIEFAVVR